MISPAVYDSPRLLSVPSSFVCPFCPLGCDDLLQDTNGEPTVQVDCPIARTELSAIRSTPVGRSLRDSESLDIQNLVSQLELPASPIVSVQNPTIEESKRLVEWLVDSRIRLSTADSDPSQRALKLTIGRDGNITATMGDLFRHADRVWVLGNPETCYPRLQEKLDGAQTPVIHSQKIEASILSSMLAAASGANDLSAPYADLFGHDYLGIIVTENAFASGEEVVCSDLLSQLIAKLNAPFSERRMRRAVLVRLNYEENLSAVLRWTTNQSLDRYSTDLPAHIRLGSPKPTDRPSQTAVRLQIGGRDLGPEFAEHFVPAAQAGVHIAATTTRADGSVTLPLLQWKETKLPTRIALLRQMIESQAKH